MFKIRSLFLIVFFVAGDISAQGFDDFGQTPRQRASKMLSKGYCSEALRIYKQLYATDSLRQDYLAISSCLTCQKKHDESIQWLQRLRFQDSQYVPVYYRIARAYIAIPNEDSALFYFRRYIKKYEERIAVTMDGSVVDPRAWLYIGNIYRVRMHHKGITDKEWIDMVYAYERYLQIRPNDPMQYQIRIFLDDVGERRPDPEGILVWDEKS